MKTNARPPVVRKATWSFVWLVAMLASGACGTGVIEDSGSRRGGKDTPGGSTGTGGSGTGSGAGTSTATGSGTATGRCVAEPRCAVTYTGVMDAFLGQ